LHVQHVRHGLPVAPGRLFQPPVDGGDVGQRHERDQQRQQRDQAEAGHDARADVLAEEDDERGEQVRHDRLRWRQRIGAPAVVLCYGLIG